MIAIRLRGRLPMLAARSRTWDVGLLPGTGAVTVAGTMALPTWPAVVGGWATSVCEHVGDEVADPWLWLTLVVWQFWTRYLAGSYRRPASPG